jgi:hypothetical protein
VTWIWPYGYVWKSEFVERRGDLAEKEAEVGEYCLRRSSIWSFSVMHHHCA